MAALALRLLTVALVIVCSSCERAINEVRIEPGTVPMRPVFVLTDTSGKDRSGVIYGLSVVRCGSDSAVWQIDATGSKEQPARITYGDAPPGYETRRGPQPLTPGCYDVFITDGRRSRFRVDAAGRVVVSTNHDTTTKRDTATKR